MLPTSNFMRMNSMLQILKYNFKLVLIHLYVVLIKFKANLKETKTTSLNLCLIHSSSLSSAYTRFLLEFLTFNTAKIVSFRFHIAIKCNLINVNFTFLLCGLILMSHSLFTVTNIADRSITSKVFFEWIFVDKLNGSHFVLLHNIYSQLPG